GGVGKSRLAHEIGAYTRERGGLLLEGAYLRDGNAAYAPWIEALRPTLRGLTAQTLEPIRAVYGPELARLFPELGPPNQDAPKVDPEEQRRRLYDGLTELVLALSREAPVVLVVNDLHWAPGLAVLSHLARRIGQARVLLVGTYREQELLDQPVLLQKWAELNRERLALQVKLRPLSGDETEQFIAQYFGPELGAALRAPLHAPTHGNAFFLEEVLRSLVETGVIGTDSGRWTLVDLTQVALPASIRLVVEERVARLGEEGREVLGQASVLGQELSFGALRALTGRSEEALLDVVERAIAARLLVDRPAGYEERYAFAGDQVQQVLYGAILAPRQRRLHLRAAQALESLYADRLENDLDELARHYLEGNDLEKALEYTVRAGKRAFALTSWEQAVLHFETALELLAELPENLLARAEVLEHLAELDAVLGRPGLRNSQEALDLYLRLGDKRKTARMHRLVGRIWNTGFGGRADLEQGLYHYEAAVKLLEDEPDSAEKALAFSAFTAGLAYGRLDLDRSLAMGERSVALAKRLGEADQIAQASTFVAMALAYRGDVVGAKAYAEQSWEATLRGGSAMYTVVTAAYPLTFWPWLNDRAWMERWLQRYVEYRDRYHVERMDRPIHGVSALIAALLGRPAAAADLLRRADETGSRQPSFYPYWLYFAGAAHAVLGDWSQARELFNSALGAAEAGHFTALFVEGALYYGRFLLRTGAVDEAARVLARPYAIAADKRSRFQLLRVSALLAEVDARSGRVSSAKAHLERARQLLGDMSKAEGVAAGVHRAEGAVAAELADWPAAEAAYASAELTERVHGFPYYEAETLAAWSQVYARRGQAGDRERELALVDRALSGFRRCAAARDVERLVARRRALGEREPESVGGANPTPADARGDVLTRREREVVALVARGLTNRQIAEELVIAEGTARIHVEHALAKLNLHSRTQLAAWAVANGFSAN
ncbi:MAG: AAA family ATPase, partial [Chloroflexi bacterium]|nr:AAA family ATPase [Chloroflexota bacterium]